MKRSICFLFFSVTFFSFVSSADDVFPSLFGEWKTEVKKEKKKKKIKKKIHRPYNTKNPMSPYYLEPQALSPKRDKNLIEQVLKETPSSDNSTINILFIAQDKPGPRSRARKKTVRIKGGRKSAKALASRADILFVISLNKEKKRWSFYSFYRGMKVPSYCKRIDLEREENYLANYYFYMGRKALIPCLEKMMNSRLKKSSELEEAMGIRAGKFHLHAFFEGTKESTIKPLARDIYNIATSPATAYRLAKIYGFNGLKKVLSVITNRERLSQNLQKALSGERVEKKDLQVNTRSLYVAAKERMAYKAGGYQRAFNFSRMIANFMTWVSYAIYYDPTIYKIFESTFDKNFSRSHSLKELIALTKMENGKSALGYAAHYKNEAQPIDIVQFGPRMSYRAFSEGQWANTSRGPLRDLVIGKSILPRAPLLDIARPILE